MINWQPLPYEAHKALVVGTLLTVGFVEGTNKRFGVYERRTRTWDETDKRHYPSVTYDVRDAETASDDDIRAGVLPRVVFRSDDPGDCEKWIKEQISSCSVS